MSPRILQPLLKARVWMNPEQCEITYQNDDVCVLQERPTGFYGVVNIEDVAKVIFRSWPGYQIAR